MVSCCAVGALSKLEVDGERMDFITFDPNQTVKRLSDGSNRSIRGTLDHDAAQVDEGLLHIGFTTDMYMTAQRLDTLLPLMAMPESPTDTFSLDNSTPECTIILEPPGSKVFTFTGCVIAGWRAHGQKGSDPVRITIAWKGKTMAEGAAGSHSFAALPTNDYVYSFTSGTMNVGGSLRAFNHFSLGMDYGTLVEFNNSIEATNICNSDHNLSLGTSVLYSTCDGNDDLLTDALSGDVTGDDGTLAFSRTVSGNTYSTTFSIGNLKLLARPPAIRKQDFVRLPLQFSGYAVGTAPLLICENIVP